MFSFYPFAMAVIDLIVFPTLKELSYQPLQFSFLLPTAMAFYSLQPLLFYFGLQYKSMGILNVYWNAVSSALIALVGFIFFYEKISLQQFIGITLCISGIILIA